MMTHGNVLATASAVLTIVPGLADRDVYLAYLPLAHILELAAEVCKLCNVETEVKVEVGLYNVVPV